MLLATVLVCACKFVRRSLPVLKNFIYTGEDVTVNMPLDFPGATLAIAHFVHEGVPQTVTVTNWLITAGGYVCSVPSSAVGPPLPAQVSEVAHLWPTVSACSPAGEEVSVHFRTIEFGELTASFKWNGGDVDYDVDTSSFLQTPTPSAKPTPSPTFSATPQASVSPTPAQLPQSGGPPAGSSGVAEVMMALAAMAAGAGGWLIARRRRRPSE